MKILTAAILFCIILLSSASCGKKEINRYNADNQKQGFWKEHTQLGTLMAFGNFDKGIEKGRWVHLDPEGRKWVTYRYGKERIRVKYFHVSGKVEKKGWARMERSPEGLNFYWDGRWKFYSDGGGRDSTVCFSLGKRISCP